MMIIKNSHKIKYNKKNKKNHFNLFMIRNKFSFVKTIVQNLQNIEYDFYERFWTK